MLTGMGADGAQAMRNMRDAGSYNICRMKPVRRLALPREATRGVAHTKYCRSRTFAPALVARLKSTVGATVHRI